VQVERELDYLQRMLYGTSRVITEHQKESQAYATLVKVISVNILYFDFGHGSDYIYHGTTTFTGIHDHDKLELDIRQQKQYGKIQINNIYPEYYLIRINNFNRIATTSLDEWIYFLKNEDIKDEFKAKGIQKAKKSFSLLSLTEKEQLAYARYQDDLRYEASLVESNYGLGRMEGKEEGIEIGIEQGIEKGKLEVANRLVEKGMSAEEAAAVAGIPVELLRN
jgi:predicted transposase/invertase (TIGR01784 family)